ncbi:MAG: hypothetical protein E7430_07275 [Ruminococcaceae bacterium]|nr:hypothetical protein [Oscillospiraceae bacterium]
MVVFKEVRKEYLKRAVIVAAALWLILMITASVLSLISEKKSMNDWMEVDITQIDELTTELHSHDTAENRMLMQQAFPYSRSYFYTSSLVTDEVGNAMCRSESFLYVKSEDGSEYYVPLEEYLTNQQIAMLESMLAKTIEYSNNLGNDYHNVFNTEIKTRYTLNNSVMTGQIHGSILIPQSIYLWDYENGCIALAYEGEVSSDAVEVNIITGEYTIRNTGHKPQTSDDLEMVQKLDTKAEAAARGDTGVKANIQDSESGYKVVTVGQVDTFAVIKNVFTNSYLLLLLFVMLGISALISDKLARKKTGIKPERPEV